MGFLGGGGGGANFWPRDFHGFCWKPYGVFLGFRFLPPFDHTGHLKSGVPPSPPPRAIAMTYYNDLVRKKT